MFHGLLCLSVRRAECFSSVRAKSPSDTKCHPEAWAPLLFSFYHRTLLALFTMLTCDRSSFQKHLIAFQTPATPTPISKAPTQTYTHARSCQLPKYCISPGLLLPALPELTPPQPRLVGKIIFYACFSSPHIETAYERHSKPALLPTFV